MIPHMFYWNGKFFGYCFLCCRGVSFRFDLISIDRASLILHLMRGSATSWSFFSPTKYPADADSERN